MCWVLSRSLSSWFIDETELTIEGLLEGGNPKGVCGALLGLACEVGTAPGGNGGDFVLLGEEFGVLLGDDWWFCQQKEG